MSFALIRDFSVVSIMKKIIQKSIPFLVFFLPFVAHAQTDTSCSNALTTVGDIFQFFICLIGKSVTPLLFLVAICIFLFGVIKYMMNANDETKRTEGREFMIWGIVALFVMLSVWGLVGVLRSTFGVSSFIPQLKQ